MDIHRHTHPDALERYSFWWSEARLLLAAVALIAGGVPPIFFVTPYPLLSLAVLGLKIAWLVSGLAAAYLMYRWYNGGMRVFGGKDMGDLLAFWVMVVSGFNLGLTGILGQNPGMTIASGRTIFFVVAIIYVVTAAYLYRRWNQRKMF
jgi:hypothetical protein